jgi:molybdopterin-guanine dinucleotide biosynthesis protein A
MEQPKALLTLPNGKSFIARALELLARVTALQLVAGGDAAWMPKGIQAYRHVADLHPGQGPLAGIEAALTSGLGKGYLVIAVDQIRLGDELLAGLLQGDKSRLHAYRIRDSIVPLPIYVPQAAQGSLGAMIAGNDRSLRRFIESSGPLFYDLPVERLPDFESVNTPDDYRRICGVT